MDVAVRARRSELSSGAIPQGTTVVVMRSHDSVPIQACMRREDVTSWFSQQELEEILWALEDANDVLEDDTRIAVRAAMNRMHSRGVDGGDEAWRKMHPRP